MLPLVLVLGSSIMMFLGRERASGTYRCPHCTELEVGTYHRLKCFLLLKQENTVQAASEIHFHDLSRPESERFGLNDATYASDDNGGGIFAAACHSGAISQTPSVASPSLCSSKS